LERHPENLLEALDLHQLMTTIPSGLFLVDLRQNIVHWNEEAARITGYSAEEVVGRHCSFLEGIECGSGCSLYDQKVPKPVVGAVCRVKAKDGRRLFLLKNVDLLRNERGEVVGGIESFNDITELRRTQLELEKTLRGTEAAVRERTAELKTEREWLRTVLDTMVDFAYISSDDFTIRYMNLAMIEVVGDRVGEKCFRAFYQRNDICEECPMPSVMEEDVVRQERVFIRPQKIYEVIHTPLRFTDGSVQKLSVYRDITDRKHHEELLEAANRDLDAFVYTVSHDLRTPLTPIIGYAEFLAEAYGDRLDDRALGLLSEIQGQGRRMVSLMEDLLALSRIGNLERPAQTVPTDEVLRQVLREFDALIKSRQSRLEVDTLPPVRIPETLLFQILANLVGNALHYAGHSGQPIEIGGEQNAERSRIYVRDHGPGVDPEQSEKIFELFYRGTSSKDRAGTGLGLGIVRKIAESYRGRAWVEPTPGGGATFWVDLPNGEQESRDHEPREI